jgi:hypothetical protein
MYQIYVMESFGDDKGSNLNTEEYFLSSSFLKFIVVMRLFFFRKTDS